MPAALALRHCNHVRVIHWVMLRLLLTKTTSQVIETSSPISLTSIRGVRYRGILTKIDHVESTIGLSSGAPVRVVS